jgi:small subunit ribosomal protein S6
MREHVRDYELIVVITPQAEEENVTEVYERLVRRPVEAHGGAIQDVNDWGRRRLAYPIGRQLEGNYIHTNLQLEPAHTKEIERGLMISEDVLRHLLVRKDA